MKYSDETRRAIEAYKAVIRAEEAFAKASRRVPEKEEQKFYTCIGRITNSRNEKIRRRVLK